jgi:hypothetical protein
MNKLSIEDEFKKHPLSMIQRTINTNNHNIPIKKIKTFFERSIIRLVILNHLNPKPKKKKKSRKSSKKLTPKTPVSDNLLIVDEINLKPRKKKKEKAEDNLNLSILRSSMRSHNRFSQMITHFNDKTASMIRVTRNSNELDDLSQLLKNSVKYNHAKEMVKSRNFRDEEFPHGVDAIMGFVQGPKTEKHKDLIWCRPKEFYLEYTKNGNKFFKPETTENYKVYQKIKPENIIQGNLGDCYFLASCAAIALNPKRLERLFISGKHYNPKGLYAIAICINGIWEEILLDDYFPCKAKSRTPAYTKNRENFLWPMLLEKAWAKVHLGYLNIASGKARDALRDLTGAPTETFNLKEQKVEEVLGQGLNEKNLKAWNALVDGFSRNFVICGSTKNFNNGCDMVDAKLGISGNHAYSVLGVYDLGKCKDFVF